MFELALQNLELLLSIFALGIAVLVIVLQIQALFMILEMFWRASWTDISNSAVQYDVSMDGAVSDGIVVAEGYASKGAGAQTIELESALRLGVDLAGNSDVFVLAADSLGGGNNNYYGSISWIEIL